jgi:2,3-bisphosphoglycerate-independent phosphoglycerate mutase
MKKNSKYIVLLGDGMSDFPIAELGNKTPLEYAKTPNMDYLAQNGIMGLAKTVPDGMPPGSDTANLSIFGYNPEKYYSGRAPLEAINMGINLNKDDVAFRCNIVNIENSIMKDFSGNHVETELSKIIIEELNKNISIENIEFFPGVSYRNIIVWRNYPYFNITETVPPHDIQDKKTSDYNPIGDGSDILNSLIKKSTEIITSSRKIQEAKLKFKGLPSSIWIWGGGKKPEIDTLNKRFGLNGYTISAVDLIHGIGRAAGLSPLHVNGATGYIDTNYHGKADALLKEIKNVNYIYLHVESPDESGHEGNLEHKLKSIEDFDKHIVGRVIEGMKKYSDYTLLLMPDHPTPISLKTHTDDPVPFCLFKSTGIPEKYKDKHTDTYNENSASSTGLYIDKGYKLIEFMINGKI